MKRGSVVWRTIRSQLRLHIVKLVIAAIAAVAVSATVTNALVPTTRTLTTDVVSTAAIDPSNTTIGVATDLYGLSDAEINRQLDAMQAVGINNVRVLLPWAGIEPFQGVYNWAPADRMVNAAAARGMGVLGILNATPPWATEPGAPPIVGRPASPAAYGTFAGLVAQRYVGKVSAYEIWNEPNGSKFYAPAPDPAGYTQLLQAAYPRIKAVDPSATVIGGVVGAGLASGTNINPVAFVDGMYQAGAQGNFDALSFHPYNYAIKFSQGGFHPETPINQLDRIHQLMVANGDSDKVIWASEYGMPTSLTSEANQADFINDMVTTWRTIDYTGPVFIFSLRDRQTGSTNIDDTYGIYRSDWTPKPAAQVIEDLINSAPRPLALSAATLSATAVEEPTTFAAPSTASPEDSSDVNPLQAAVTSFATQLSAAVTNIADSLQKAQEAATATDVTGSTGTDGEATSSEETGSAATEEPQGESVTADDPRTESESATETQSATQNESATKSDSSADEQSATDDDTSSDDDSASGNDSGSQ
jgi:polysaccharide biosynthesis protein PslG